MQPSTRRRWRRIVACAAAGIVLVAGLPSVGAAGPASGPTPDFGTDAAGTVEPTLRSQLDSTGVADFWVRLEQTADLASAGRIDDWRARGDAVAGALREVAEASQAEVRERLDAAGADYQPFWVTNAIHVRSGSSDLAGELAAHPAVDSLHSTTEYEVPEPDESDGVQTLSSTVEWGVANVNADTVWEQYGVRGAGITVANIDTGVQYSHPALVNQYRGNLGDSSFDHHYNWFDATGACPDGPCDTNGHGTHTMGTIVGDDGGDNRIGVAPEVNWIAANGCCPSDAALIASGQWMLEPTDLNGENPDASRRPHIINNSWGSTIPSNDPFMTDVAAAWAASGIFGVWSNGNMGPACATSGSPGSLAMNYSVGAHDIDNAIGAFSSRGAGEDGAVKPDITAPGVDVRSALPNNGYGSFNGTSMAAPHVAGAIALLWSAAPTILGDVASTRSMLDGTAIDTPDDTCGGTPEHNNVFGQGRLDALALLDAAEIGDTGTLAVSVTDSATGDPVAGAELAIEGLVGRERVTGDDGTYSLPLPPGDYTVAASAFGYADRSADATVTTDEITTLDLSLEALPTASVSGQVTDGSGQGWPLYARVTVSGMPGGTVHTDPADGGYEVTLPAGDSYTLTVRSLYDGYDTVTETIEVGGADLTHDIAVPVDGERCVAAGYSYGYDGAFADFNDKALPDGWTVVDHNGSGHGWVFDDPFDRGNNTGGDGGFAIAQTPGGPIGEREIDASLVTPEVDLTGQDTPVVGFRQDFNRLLGTAHLDLSIDGGETWETILAQDSNVRGPREEALPIPQAAGQSRVQVRFRLFDEGFSTRFWQVDDAYVGTRTCEPDDGGLVLGHVRDRNTDEPVNGAVVTRDDDLEVSARSEATPDDADLDDGFYWMFVPGTDTHRFTATADHYRPHQSGPLAVGGATELDFRLPAGRLVVAPPQINRPVRQGEARTATFTIINDGSAPAQLELRERDGQYPIPRGQDGVETTATTTGEVVRVPGEFSPLASGGTPMVEGSTIAPDSARSAGSSWVDLPPYPFHVMDNAVGEHEGRIYSAGGRTAAAIVTDGFVYDPEDRTWSAIADLPALRQAGAGAFIDGKFYVAGGWGVGLPDGQGTRTMFIYDPETDQWSQGADAPFIFAAAGRAVLDGQLYVVGGCTNNCLSSRVFRYDPPSDSWDELARYPEPVSHQACGGMTGQVYCAGGTAAGGVIWPKTYAYDPETDTWTRKADMPFQLWGMSYTASSERLLVSGGVTGGTTERFTTPGPTELTNEGFIYEPATDTWLSLPASNNLTYRGGNTCGLTKVGGTRVVGFSPFHSAELLPTYGDCVPADVPWLSLDTTTMTLEPGQRARVTVTLDATGTAPGTHAAGVWVKQDTPYLTYPLDVTMTVLG